MIIDSKNETQKSILTNNRTEYLAMTQNAYVFRNTVMYFALIKNNIVIPNIFKSLRNINLMTMQDSSLNYILFAD